MGSPGLDCLAVEATAGQTAVLCRKSVLPVGLVLLSHSPLPARPAADFQLSSPGSYCSENRVVQGPQGDHTLGHLDQKQQRQGQCCCTSSSAVASLQESLKK